MAFNRIPNVTIAGKESWAGGRIYDVSLDIGVAQDASKLTITAISENGNYIDPELSMVKPYSIKIGNWFNEKYYAYRFEERTSSKGRILTTNFIDGSSILDRIYVGLWKKMGSENGPSLLLVGREFHPCDIDQDGVYSSRDADQLTMSSFDGCQIKCPGDIAERENIIEACTQKEITELFDVAYSFQDLLDGLRGKKFSNSSVNRTFSFIRPSDKSNTTSATSVTLPQIQLGSSKSFQSKIKIKNVPAKINANFNRSYTGTLRSVLQQWCADFGWTFYWENDSLNFIDVKERPKINFSDFDNLESKVRTKTLEGTVARGFISYYGEPGIEASNDCQNVKPYLLRCMNLKDLYGEFYKPAWNAVAINNKNYSQISVDDVTDISLAAPTSNNEDNQITYFDSIYPNGVPIQEFEKICALSFYSQTLRDLYTLWGYYELNTMAAMEDAEGKWLDRMGQRKVVRVFGASSNGREGELYNKILGNDASASGRERQGLVPDEVIDRIEKWGGYFVVMLRNPNIKKDREMLNIQFETEERIASNFIGSHWFRPFKAANFGADPQIVPNAEYLSALSTNIDNLPFASFNHTYRSNVSKMINSFGAVEQKQTYFFNGVKQYMSSPVVNKTRNKKLLRSMIYLNRRASDYWNPIKNGSPTLNQIVDGFTKFAPIKLDISESLASMLVRRDGQLIDGIKEEHSPYIELWVMFPGQFNINATFEEHPYEEPIIKDEGLGPYEIYSAGLMSKQTVVYSFDTAKNDVNQSLIGNAAGQQVKIYLPAGGSVLHSTSLDNKKFSFSKTGSQDTIDFSVPSYKVFVVESFKNRGLIPKTESTLVLHPPNIDAMSVEYEVVNINKNDAIRFLNRLTSDCRLPDNEIAELHRKFSENLTYSVTEPFETREYVVHGVEIPGEINIKNGLEKISISINQNGVFTTIGVGNSLFVPTSREFDLHKLENLIPKHLYNARKNPI